MSLLPRLLGTLALLALVSPSVMAGSSACSPNEFWYDNQSCCAPYSPPQTYSSPPPGKSCPSSDTDIWYWDNDKSCCLPTAPPPPSHPAPTCQSGHVWSEAEGCCTDINIPSTPGPNDCSNGEFWFQPTTTCLPYGGPPNPPKPPTGSHCPQSEWYWDGQQGCCVPLYPTPPAPKCKEESKWRSRFFKCTPVSTPPSTPTPQPTYHYGDYTAPWKRAQKQRGNSLCPNEMTACPVVGPYGVLSDYECIDTDQELQSCGGCSSTGAGQDCTAIRGAWNVGCEYGHCRVFNCMTGYKLAKSGTACIPL